jgi:hypothetical protein
MLGDLGEVRSVLDVDAVVANVILFQQGTELGSDLLDIFHALAGDVEDDTLLGSLGVNPAAALDLAAGATCFNT